MSNNIICPECLCEIEITEAMSTQLAAGIRAELQAEFTEKTRKLADQREELARGREELDASRAELEKQVEAAVAKEREVLAAKLRVEAQQAVAVEIADRDEQLAAAKTKLKEFEAQELELRRKTRALDEEREQQELAFARRLDDERQEIRKSAIMQAQEQHELKHAEKDDTIKSLLKQLEEMKRRAEQGSQQSQGDVQEIALERLLTEAFPNDVIKRVGKGVCGGDAVHHVFDPSGRECGVILWESKRTKEWSDKWIGKAINDQQEVRAACVCIVTAAMPDGIDHFGEINGMWVASWSCARSAAMALRRVLIETAQARVAADGQHSKRELVYNYLSGPEFRNRVRGLIEPYIEMEADLHSEMRALNVRWKKRRKLLDRAMASMTGLYGDLQGIIGSSMQQIEGMELLVLESANDTDEVGSDKVGL